MIIPLAQLVQNDTALIMLMKLVMLTVHGLVDISGQLIRSRQSSIISVNQPMYNAFDGQLGSPNGGTAQVEGYLEFDYEFDGFNHRDESVVTEGKPVMLILDIDFLAMEKCPIDATGYKKMSRGRNAILELQKGSVKNDAFGATEQDRINQGAYRRCMMVGGEI